MRRLFLSVIILLLFNACSVYNTINFEILSPSEITIPTDVKTIAFVYRNTWTQEDTAYLKKNKIEDKEVEEFTELIKVCYQGFSDIIIPTEKYDSVYFHIMKQEIIKDRKEIPLLNWDTVNSICSKLGADILFVLEKSKFIVSKEYLGDIQEPVIYNSIKWDFHIRCYDPLYSKILDSKVYNDSIDITNLMHADRFVDPMSFELERLSYSIGELYAMRINPHWKEISRKIYSTGNKKLSAGYFYYKSNKYKTAISVWKQLLTETKPKYAARACINISNANEMLGKIEEAKKYASLSLFYYNKFNVPKDEFEYVNRLIKKLQRRIIEQKILDEQF